ARARRVGPARRGVGGEVEAGHPERLCPPLHGVPSGAGGRDSNSRFFGCARYEWAKIEPLMPRGRRGAHRLDDRRVISGIVRMLRSGARWRDCPPAYGPYTTIYNRFNRWSRQGIWFEMFEALTGRRGSSGRSRSTARSSKRIARRLAEKGAYVEAVGRSRGGRTTKIHALTDAEGRPRLLLLSPGNAHDVVVAPTLIAAAGPISRLLADKAYDTNPLRAL